MEKICPFALANSNLLDFSCEKEGCQWWDEENNCCCINTLVKTLNYSENFCEKEN